MAGMRSLFTPLVPRDCEDTVLAPVVDSQVDIAIYPHRWAVSPRTAEHKAAVQWHGNMADKLLVRTVVLALLAAPCIWAYLAWVKA